MLLVDDEHVDNHSYDDNTDDGHDNSKDICGHIAILCIAIWML